MSTNQLRVEEVRDAYRLIGECRDLGGDPALWQARLMDGARELVGAPVAVGGEGGCTGREMEIIPVTSVAAGLDEAQLKDLEVFTKEVGPRGCPIFVALRKAGGDVTRARSEIVSDRDWYRSKSYLVRGESRLDHQLTSLRYLRARKAVLGICISQGTGEPDFSERQRQLIAFLHDELVPLVGRSLVSAVEPSPWSLSPRLRQTLACLLEGDSEKQVAARLKLSVPTAHQYVTALYRHFGVSSRAQLLAHALRRARLGQWAEFLSGASPS